MAYRSDGSIPLTVQKTLLFPDFIILSFLHSEKSRMSLYITSEYILIFAHIRFMKNNTIIAAVNAAANIYR